MFWTRAQRFVGTSFHIGTLNKICELCFAQRANAQETPKATESISVASMGTGRLCRIWRTMELSHTIILPGLAIINQGIFFMAVEYVYACALVKGIPTIFRASVGRRRKKTITVNYAWDDAEVFGFKWVHRTEDCSVTPEAAFLAWKKKVRSLATEYVYTAPAAASDEAVIVVEELAPVVATEYVYACAAARGIPTVFRARVARRFSRNCILEYAVEDGAAFGYKRLHRFDSCAKTPAAAVLAWKKAAPSLVDRAEAELAKIESKQQRLNALLVKAPRGGRGAMLRLYAIRQKRLNERRLAAIAIIKVANTPPAEYFA